MNPKEVLNQFKEQKTEQKPEPKIEQKPVFPESAKYEEPKPMTIMTEKDAYIAERMKSQPSTLEEIEVVKVEDKKGIHRLSLPDYFEQYSYDCTRGIGCEYHGWAKEEVHYGLEMKMDRWNQTKRGKYVFRWLNSNPRALDHNINVRGWYLVNKTYFSDAPKINFSVNGGVLNGDSILAFMPVSKAIAMREKPSRDSLDRVNSEERKHENHPNFYKAKLDPERFDGDDYAPTGALQEGRDFKV